MIINMKVMMILIVVDVLRTVPKSLERGLEELEIRERIETIQTIAKESRSLEETWCQSDSSERPPVKTGVKNSLVVK